MLFLNSAHRKIIIALAEGLGFVSCSCLLMRAIPAGEQVFPGADTPMLDSAFYAAPGRWLCSRFIWLRICFGSFASLNFSELTFLHAYSLGLNLGTLLIVEAIHISTVLLVPGSTWAASTARASSAQSAFCHAVIATRPFAWLLQGLFYLWKCTTVAHIHAVRESD
jgi:hypothetical protein